MLQAIPERMNSSGLHGGCKGLTSRAVPESPDYIGQRRAPIPAPTKLLPCRLPQWLTYRPAAAEQGSVIEAHMKQQSSGTPEPDVFAIGSDIAAAPVFTDPCDSAIEGIALRKTSIRE